MEPLPVFIQDWAAYSPGLIERNDWQQWATGQASANTTDQPQVSSIPAMLRRRLSPSGKMALSVAYPLLGEGEQLPCIFASRHGELNRTIHLLTELSAQEPLSPTQFSLSVHNAIGGVMSIARNDHSCITALATDDENTSSAVIEAIAIMQEQNSRRALCILYDDTVPDIYRDQAGSDFPPYALALLLSQQSATADTQALTLTLTTSANTATSPASDALAEPQALSLLRFLLNSQQQALRLNGRGLDWCWNKVAVA